MDPEQLAVEHQIWSGEVVGVDEVACRLFVKIGESVPRPCAGDFAVRPFDFLEALESLYSDADALGLADQLQAGLRRTAGIKLPARIAPPVGDPALRGVWDHDWGLVWGPPGTGKTHTIGEQVAAAIGDPSEQILVVSTTNRATDEAAVSIARGLEARGRKVTRELLRRVGSGGDSARVRENHLTSILDTPAPEVRERLARVLRERARARDSTRRAELWARARELQRWLAANQGALLEDPAKIIVTTSYIGVRALQSDEAQRRLASGDPPFTTVVIDEAGLVSRVAAAALSLWASRRVIVVGDPRQLSPISRISRVLEPRQAMWIAHSAVEHVSDTTPGSRQLRVQYRMHPEIRKIVSDFSYRGALEDAPVVASREFCVDAELDAGPRALWYVLDVDAGDLPRIRADRGPGGRSWVRQRSREVVQRLFHVHSGLTACKGLFVAPFVAQAREVAAWFAAEGLDRWSASTTHSQQGTEADVVILDTVHASSTAWPYSEWQRLINVGMSRARELLVVLATREEMREPYLRGLSRLLRPRALVASGGRLRWRDVSIKAPTHALSQEVREHSPTRLGSQLESRKSMMPILSAEQQRLCMLPVDGKPRLIRGVAGSGKTAVLAHWLARRVADPDETGRFWVVYANNSLLGLLRDMVDVAWKNLGQDGEFTWDRVEPFHVLHLLTTLECELGLRPPRGRDGYDFEGRARRLLTHDVAPRCGALFADEAQDMGEATLALLARLVEPVDQEAPNARAMSIFYDNAQNVYGRGTPKWVDLGLDMTGRSTVMKESFRSTLPTTEFALNALYRMQDPSDDPDHAELIRRNLIQKEQRNDRAWWRVRFNEIEGPLPDYREFPDRGRELRALSGRVRRWIGEDGVRPADIKVIVNTAHVRDHVVERLRADLISLSVRVEARTRERPQADDHVVIVTTAHTFKGYDAEIVAVPAADRFVAKVELSSGNIQQILAPALYVALTRARSVLYVSATTSSTDAAARIPEVLRTTFEDQRSVPVQTLLCSETEEHLELVLRVGSEHRSWLARLAKDFGIRTGPICRTDGSIVVEPLFHVKTLAGTCVFFEQDPTPWIAQELDDLKVRRLHAGEYPDA